jgi:hypothetical protein
MAVKQILAAAPQNSLQMT